MANKFIDMLKKNWLGGVIAAALAYTLLKDSITAKLQAFYIPLLVSIIGDPGLGAMFIVPFIDLPLYYIAGAFIQSKLRGR